MTLVPSRWIVALPAWGERCLHILRHYTLPALHVAFQTIDRSVEFMIWTDRPDLVQERPAGVDVPSCGALVSFHAVPGPDGAFESLSNCHRAALAAAGPADRVLLLTSDMVVSREIVATCEYWLAHGRKLVCCVPPRALQDAGPPIGASGPELMEWAWANRHPMTRECTWPEGRSYDVWRMYFERDGEVAARVFLPHPLACTPFGRRMNFRPTIDVNLCANFSQAETYMITRPEEGSVVEVSPTDKDFLLTTNMRERYDAGGPSCPPLIKATNPRHRMFFGKRVVIRGSGGDCGDSEVVGRVLG